MLHYHGCLDSNLAVIVVNLVPVLFKNHTLEKVWVHMVMDSIHSVLIHSIKIMYTPIRYTSTVPILYAFNCFHAS